MRFAHIKENLLDGLTFKKGACLTLQPVAKCSGNMTPARSSFDQFTVTPTEMQFYFGTPLFAIQAVVLLQGMRSSSFSS